jgi:uncharacterized protein YjbI with pentapeptide repeats
MKSLLVHHAIGLLLALSCAVPAVAANSKDVARAKNTGQLGECTRCDLSGANLENGFFQLAVLNEANISSANLNGANLAGAQLNNANMRNATLVYANLSGARMEGADLRGADLSQAWLNWAWFAGAKLDGVNFTNAKMIGAQLQGADLSKAIGLTKSQLDQACGDSQTKLPPGMKAPFCLF